MGEKTWEALKLQFDKRLRLESHRTRNSSDTARCLDAAGWLRRSEQACQPSYTGISLTPKPKMDENGLIAN